MDEVRWERMFPDQLERRFAEAPVLYLTYGLCEPHGPHNAVGLDALKAHGIACAAARRGGGIVAPPDYWHIHEVGDYAIWSRTHVGEVARDWLTALPPWQHFKNICYQLRAADRIGFKAVVLLTGHYGQNYRDLKTMIGLVQPFIGARLLSLPDFEADREGIDGQGPSRGDHAGRIETSQLWAVEPDCVDSSRLPPHSAPGPHFAMGPDAPQSSRRDGEAMVARQAVWLADRARELLAAYDEVRPTARLMGFRDVERLWESVVAPALPGFLTMQRDGTGQDRTVPPDSRWHLNWLAAEEQVEAG